MLEVTIQGIGLNQNNYQPFVLLRETDGERYLPILIGSDEANAIAVKLHDASFPRPLSSDLLLSVINILGASIGSIIINDLKDTDYLVSYPHRHTSH